MLQGRRKEDWKKGGVYCITCVINNKKYIGVSNNIYTRINQHKVLLNQNNRKGENQYLIADWNKYGYDNFDYTVLEYFDKILSKKEKEDKEFYWINKLNTIDRNIGYNLRRDSSKTGMIALDETKQKYSEANKKRFEKEEERRKIGIKSSLFWKNNPEIKKQMADKVSKKLTEYYIDQYTKDNIFIKRWNRVIDIIKKNPIYKKHNIYAVCSGEKPTTYGYIWRKCQI